MPNNIEQSVRSSAQKVKEGARRGAQRVREGAVGAVVRGHQRIHEITPDILSRRPARFRRASRDGAVSEEPRTLAEVAGITPSAEDDVVAHAASRTEVPQVGTPPEEEQRPLIDTSDHNDPEEFHSLRPRASRVDVANPDTHRNGTSPNGTSDIPASGEGSVLNGSVRVAESADDAAPHLEAATAPISEEQQAEENRRHLMGVDAYREITSNGIQINPDSTRDDLMRQLHDRGHNWQDDKLTQDYIDAAIERAKLPQDKWAARELEAKGVQVEEGDTAQSLLDKVREKDSSWDNSQATLDYVGQALPQTDQQDDSPADKQDDRDMDPPTIEKKDHREGDDIVQKKQVAEGVTPGVETERVHSADVRYLEPELSDDNGYSMYLGPQAMEQWGVHEGERVRAVNDRGQEYFVEVHAAIKRDTGEIEDMDSSPYIRMSSRAIDHLGFRGEPVIPEIGSTGEGQKELKLKSAEVIKDVVNTPELRGIHIQEVEAGVSSELSLTPQMLEMWGVKPGDVITVRHGKVAIPGITIAASAAPEGEDADKAPSWDMKLSKEEGEKLKALEGFSLRSKFNKDSKELSVGPSIAFVTAMNIERTGDSEFAQVARMAEEYGVMAYVVNKDISKQGPDFEALKKEGMMWAYVYKDGEYKKVKAPIADVLYEKDSNTDNNEFWQTNFEHTMFPMDVQINTHYKQQFTEKVLDAIPELKGFYPDTIAVPERATTDEQRDSIQKFLDEHGEVILKPNSGQNGRGIISVSRGEDGSYVFKHGNDEPQTLTSVDDILSHVDEVKKRIRLAKSGIGEDYIMQEKLKLQRVTYKDPVTGEELTGIPEPRILTQRGPDGKVRVVGQLVKMQDPRMPDGMRLTNGRGGLIDFHVTDLRETLVAMYGDEAEEIQKTLNRLAVIEYDAVEKASGGAQAGELPMDYLLPEGKPPQILEINYKGNVGTLVEHSNNLKDAKYYAAAGPLQHTLAVTGYN